MSNTDARLLVDTGDRSLESPSPHPVIEVLDAREVPLGGPRAMTVRRTLPQRQRSLIGAWCFADHYGPDNVSTTGGMRVPPHPHTGLQTVSWLFTGEIEHRDSIGYHAMVRPGELNLMTAGSGIAHSEVSTSATTVLHGMQLWVALPDQARQAAPAFEHHVPDSFTVGAATMRVFLGTLAGQTSPVPTFTPLLGAEILLPAHTELELDIDPGHEHGLIVDQGEISLAATLLTRGQLGYQGPGCATLHLRNDGSGDARALLLGGEPFGEQVVMWWNFMGRSSDEIVAYRAQWQAEIGDGSTDRVQFGAVPGYPGEPLPAPHLPNSPLRPRG